MSHPQQSGPMSLEDRLTQLEEQVKDSNKNMTDGLQALIDQLKEMKARQCELPPFCETP